MRKITIETRRDGDFVAVSINGVEKELHKHDGVAIEALVKVIQSLWKPYA